MAQLIHDLLVLFCIQLVTIALGFGPINWRIRVQSLDLKILEKNLTKINHFIHGTVFMRLIPRISRPSDVLRLVLPGLMTDKDYENT